MNSRKHKSCLVVGASGNVGSRLCRAACETGLKTYGLARFGNPEIRKKVEATGTETVAFDIVNDNPVELPDVDLVFFEVWNRAHIGGEHLENLWELNFDGVGRIIRRYAGEADFVNGSTGSLYGPRGDRPSLETDWPEPRGQYSLARLAQEKLFNFFCKESGSKVAHLRYFHSNSPESGILRRIADTILAEKSLGKFPDMQVQAIGIKDFVRCTFDARNKLGKTPFVCNVCHPKIWSYRELAERLQKELGTGKVLFDADNGGRDNSAWGSTTKMIAEFGNPVEELDELIRQVAAAARQDSK